MRISFTPTLAVVLAGLALSGGVALGQTRGAAYATPPAVQASDGEGVYREVCQACHMPDGRGAAAAAAYPGLAENPRLEVAGYPVTLVLRGQRAMPGFSGMLTDAQVAGVVDYVRTHFGNDYRDKVDPADVRALR